MACAILPERLRHVYLAISPSVLQGVTILILSRIDGGVEASSILLQEEEKDHGKGAKDLYRRV